MRETSAGQFDPFRAKALRALRRSPHEPYTGADERPRPIRAPSSEAGYRGDEAAEIVGITHRQLDYWARTDLVGPSLADPRGHRTDARYSYRDLLDLQLVKALLDGGMKPGPIRQALRHLRDRPTQDVARATVVVAGDSAMVVGQDEQLVDVIERHRGRGVLHVLALRGVKEQVDAMVVEPRLAAGPSEAAG